jgi:hypothetical protein
MVEAADILSGGKAYGYGIWGGGGGGVWVVGTGLNTDTR